LAPGAGNSTKTRSPSCSCAWSVIPTVAISPSTRSHSWSSVNFNIAIDSRGSVALVAMWDEGQITDLQRNALAAYFGENPFIRRRKIFVDVTHRDRRLHRRPEAARRNSADRGCRDLVRVELGAAAHRHALLAFQSDAAARRAVYQLAQNDLGAGKSAGARSAGATDLRNCPFERGHHRCRCRIEIGTVETKPGFEPQAVARAETDGHYRIVLA